MDATTCARLEAAIDARGELVEPTHRTAFRLFNGFVEGLPSLVLDVYGRTLVVHDHADAPDGDEPTARAALESVLGRLSWVRAAVWKVRNGATPEARHGRLLLGTEKDLDRKIRENDVWYAVALASHKDATFYLDTRELRAFAKRELAGLRVLNTFAYTGSLGVAARAAPASEVVHVDKSRTFLNVAKDSYALNGFLVRRGDFRAEDIFEAVGRLKREDALFDCVFVDPPFFSTTAKGRVDLEADMARVLNKVRPLVGHEGRLVAVNNALFVSGADYVRSLEALCADGYLAIERFVEVPADVAGYPATRVGAPPSDPAPFAHSTKIAVLRVRRKDGRRAS